MPTQPSGEVRKSCARLIRLVVSKAGVGLIDSRIGAKATDTSTDPSTKRKKPDVSGISSMACAAMMPTICTIM